MGGTIQGNDLSAFTDAIIQTRSCGVKLAVSCLLCILDSTQMPIKFYFQNQSQLTGLLPESPLVYGTQSGIPSASHRGSVSYSIHTSNRLQTNLDTINELKDLAFMINVIYYLRLALIFENDSEKSTKSFISFAVVVTVPSAAHF